MSDGDTAGQPEKRQKANWSLSTLNQSHYHFMASILTSELLLIIVKSSSSADDDGDEVADEEGGKAVKTDPWNPQAPVTHSLTLSPSQVALICLLFLYFVYCLLYSCFVFCICLLYTYYFVFVKPRGTTGDQSLTHSLTHTHSHQVRLP